MRNRIVGVLVVVLFAVAPSLVAADDIGGTDPIVVSPAPTPAPPPADEGWKFFWERGRYLGQFELTGRPGTRELHGFSPDLMIPIAQDERNLIFLNTTGQIFWNDGRNFNELNVGMGYRRLMGDGAWILGGYAYWDRIWTEFDNTFDQATLGIEALSFNWEGRMNGYVGPSSLEFASTAGVSAVTLVGSSLVVNSFVEQQTNGFDAEVGWRLPFFGDEGWLSDTRILAGGFWFDAEDLRSFGGPMVRFETRIWEVPFLPEESRLTLGTSYRWDDVRKNQVQGQIAVRIPLGRPDASYRPLSNVERRMMDRPVRDVSVVSITGNSAEGDRVVTGTGVVLTDGYYFDAGDDGDGSYGNPFSVDQAEDRGENVLLIGLDREGPIDIDDTGTIDLKNGQAWIGGGTQLQLIGQASSQPALFRPRGTGARFIDTSCCDTAFDLALNNIIGGFHFDNVYNPILYTAEMGDRTKFRIYDNHFQNFHNAIELVTYYSEMDARIEGNIFEGIGHAGVYTLNEDGWFDVDLTVRNNRFSFLGGGGQVMGDVSTQGILGGVPGIGIYNRFDPDSGEGEDDRGSRFNFVAHDNVFDILSYGIKTEIDLDFDEELVHTAHVSENQFSQLLNDAYRIDIDGDDDDDSRSLDSTITVRDNLLTRSLGNLVDLDVNRRDGDDDDGNYYEGIYNGQLTVNVAENRITKAGGIAIDVYRGPDTEINVVDNELFGVFGLQIEDIYGNFPYVDIEHNAAIDVYVGRSGSRGVGDDDDDFGSPRDGEHRINIDGNLVEGSQLVRSGIEVAAVDNAPTHVDVTNNVVRNVNCLTCRLEGFLGDDDDLDDSERDPTSVRGISVSMVDNGSYGYEGEEEGPVENTLAINGNTVEFVGSPLANIFADIIDGGGVSVAGIGDDDDQFRDYGIYANVAFNSRTETQINRNDVYGITGIGIGAIFTDSAVRKEGDIGDFSSAEINRNRVDATGDAGIAVAVYYEDYFDLDINQNHVTRSLARGGITDPQVDAGIGVFLFATDYSEVQVDGNTVEDVGQSFFDDDGNGIEVNLYNADYNAVSVSRNEITRVAEHGIEADVSDDSYGNVLTINDNTIRTARENGIDIWVDGDDDDDSTDNTTLSIGGNDIQYVDDGIQIDARSYVYLDSDRNNDVPYYRDDDFDYDLNGGYTGQIEVNDLPRP